jgi:hypothetical protein
MFELRMHADNDQQSAVSFQRSAEPLASFKLNADGCTLTAGLVRVYLRVSAVALLFAGSAHAATPGAA